MQGIHRDKHRANTGHWEEHIQGILLGMAVLIWNFSPCEIEAEGLLQA